MSTNEENINTASIEEMINANLGIDTTELEATSSEASPEVDELLATEIPEEVIAADEAEIITEESTDTLELAETMNEEFEEPLESTDINNENEDKTDIALEGTTEPAIEETEPDITNDIEESIATEATPVEIEESLVEPNIETDTDEVAEIITENTAIDESEIPNEEVTDTVEEAPTEASNDDSSNDAEPMLALETEVSELESEIQEQLEQFAVQAENLKSNIQNELQRVSSDNKQLQEQVSNLAQQLSSAEEKIQSFTEVQDKQQATIHKLILIIKGIRTKISHLYDEE